MKNALADGDLSVEKIDHINCHATSTPTGDSAEAFAIENLIKHDKSLLEKVTVTAIKS